MNSKEMTLEELIEDINKRLATGRSMRKIEMLDYGVSEGSLVRRLERNRVFREGNKFIKLEDEELPMADKLSALSSKKRNKKNMDIIIREPKELLNNEYFVNVANRVEMLEKVVAELMVRANNNSVVEEENTDFIVYSSDEKPVGKTVRLYPEIWEGLDKVKEIYPHLSAQTIINSLLNYAINQHLK